MTAAGTPTLPGSRLSRGAYLAGRRLGRVALLARRAPTPPPWAVLAALVVANWVVLLEIARIASHDGWLYFQGGDATWYYTSAWLIAHGHLPFASIGYGYSVLIAPIAYFAGPNMLDGLPAIVVFDLAVLAPIALLCVYGIARMIGGRAFGYFAALAWAVFPVAIIHYFLPDYHANYVDVTLPPALGLTARGDFPSLVFLLVAAYFGMRGMYSGVRLDFLGSGLALGFAIAVKPSNALFVPAIVVALPLARRFEGLLLVGAGLVPSLVGLAFWKYYGIGYLPVFRSTAGAYPPGTMAAAPMVGLNFDPGHYLPIHWDRISNSLDGFREYTVSRRLVEWVAVGGLVGLARRSVPAAALIGLWLASFFVVKSSSPLVKFSWGSYLTHLIPAFPAYFVLAISIPFLIPVLGRRKIVPAILPGMRPGRPLRLGVYALAAVAVASALVVAVLPPVASPTAVDFFGQYLYLPLDGFAVSSSVSGGAVTLEWSSQRPSAERVSYAIFRDRPGAVSCARRRKHASTLCVYYPNNQVGSVQGDKTSWVDHPPPGRWVYRVVLSASPGRQQFSNDYILASRPTPTIRIG
ncbi:MAG TPA: hypothetical protein VG265_13010 [Gaiellaceae bacterium]|jgi:hypothetical protein|nr:hypothetical protein [Gaiellaceae bacterium]